jgi:uncharacterized membrane protein YraQ (UPF0718 family)
MKTEEGKIVNERKIDWTAVLIGIVPSVIIAIVIGLIWYGATDVKLEALEAKTNILETKCEDIGVIKNELTWIKEGITDIKRSLNGERKFRNGS